MHLSSRRTLPVAAAVLALGLSACGSGGDASHGPMTAGSGGSVSAPGGAVSGVEADVKFAQMMIPHHEQALEMATLALENDTASADVKSLARQIEAAQDPEIQVMKGWLSQWGAQESSGPMDHGPGGMMSEEDMDALKAASGADFDQMWLRMMIEHHQGAVTMAQDVLAATDDADVKKLANAVVTGQQEEIATMQGMIGGS